MEKFYFNFGSISLSDAPYISVFQTGFDIEQYSDSLITDLHRSYKGFLKNAVRKRKSEFIAGRYCAHQSLTAWCYAEKFVGVGEGRCPEWPAGIVGSISHCQAYALVATARSSDYFALGLDVEIIVDNEVKNSLLKSVFNGDELFLLREANTYTPNVNFTLVFSMKESFFKAAYPHVKKFFDFSAISILEIDMAREHIHFKVNQTIGSIFKSGSKFTGQFKLIENRKIITLFSIDNHRKINAEKKHLTRDNEKNVNLFKGHLY